MRPLECLLAEPRVLEPDSLAIARTDPGHNLCAGLADLLRSLPRLGLAVEVGSHRGVSAEVILRFADHVLAVDPWPDQRPKREFDARFTAEGRLSYLRLPSLEAARLLADGSADLVYLDADHHYEHARADVAAWRPKVRRGGWLAGHDYSELVDGGGVIRAVAEAFGKPDAVFADTSWLVRLPG